MEAQDAKAQRLPVLDNLNGPQPPSQTSLTWIESELRPGKRVSLQRATIHEANDRQVRRRLCRRSSRENAGERRRTSDSVGIGRRFVYILRSDSDPQCHYVGIASDPDERLHWHNEGPCGYTTSHRPCRSASTRGADRPSRCPRMPASQGRAGLTRQSRRAILHHLSAYR